MYCKYCGKEIKDTAKFCPVCGEKVLVSTEPKASEGPAGSNNKKLLITILAIVSVVVIVAIIVAVSSKSSDKSEVTKDQVEIEDSVEKTEEITETDNTDEIFEAFLTDKIPAISQMDSSRTVYYSELCNMEPIVTPYREGGRVDLDNDGQKELIIEGDFGGMYLDARDGKVYIFAEGDGTAVWLSHVYYKDAYLILYSDIMHQGRSTYFFEQYSGADNLVDSFELSAYYMDQDSYDENSDFIFRNEHITMQEYERLYTEIFNNYSYVDSKVPFYGIWVYASKDYAEACEFAKKVEWAGYVPSVFLSSEWDNLNSDSYYVVSAGIYNSNDEAENVLDDIISAGFDGAYIKFSGNYNK